MKYEIRSIVCDYAIYEEGNDEYSMFYEEDIKSIVTKEQFKSMQYEVK